MSVSMVISLIPQWNISFVVADSLQTESIAARDAGELKHIAKRKQSVHMQSYACFGCRAALKLFSPTERDRKQLKLYQRKTVSLMNLEAFSGKRNLFR